MQRNIDSTARAQPSYGLIDENKDALTMDFQHDVLERGVDWMMGLKSGFATLSSALFIITFCIVFTYGVVQVQLYRCTSVTPSDEKEPDPVKGNVGHPFVTIQLPIYNEVYVVEDLIDNIMKLRWPKRKFEVQVLDDSNDETVKIVRRKVSEYAAKGFSIRQIRRPVRHGFKAGALQDCMDLAKGKFIAIFDADFLPREDFLRRTMLCFKDPEVCCVQTRWETLNEDYSLLTRLQNVPLNTHFRVEQEGRYQGGYLCQFNGTAGIWRKEAIVDAGGWHCDTITEDVDLSFRAQMAGWKIRYLNEVGTPGEMPADMNSLKSQQFRWTKGQAEVARKLLPTIWSSDDLEFSQKAHASVHLLASSSYPALLVNLAISLPVVFLQDADAFLPRVLGTLPLVNSVLFLLVHYFGNVDLPTRMEGGYWKKLLKYSFVYPLYQTICVGISLHCSIGVLQAWMGKRSPFVRTPKFNIKDPVAKFSGRKYLATRIEMSTILDGVLALYFTMGMMFGLYTGKYAFIALHAQAAAGFLSVFVLSVMHMK